VRFNRLHSSLIQFMFQLSATILFNDDHNRISETVKRVEIQIILLVETLGVHPWLQSWTDLGLVRPQATVIVGPQPPHTPFLLN